MKSRTIFLLCCFICLIGTIQVDAQPPEPKNKAIQKTKPSIAPYKDENTNLYGFRDVTGVLVIPCKYAFAYGFSEGLAAVNMGGKLKFDKEYTNEYFVQGGKWGYINETGKLIIPCKYDGADFFNDGFAIVDKVDKKGFIDKTGKEITPFTYEYINPFSEGLAAVGGGDPLKFSYIDKTGKVIITGEYSAADNFNNGKARVTRYGAIYFINKNGERLK